MKRHLILLISLWVALGSSACGNSTAEDADSMNGEGIGDGYQKDGEEQHDFGGDKQDGTDVEAGPFDFCDGAPPNSACYAQRRDPESESVALASAIADRYIDLHPATDLLWAWENTVLMFGIYELYRVTGEQRYLDYMQSWIDKHIEAELGYFMFSSDSMSPAQAAAFLYFETGGKKYEAVVEEALDYLDNVAVRTEDGGISHKGRMGNPTLWLDSLFMFGGLLTRWGEHIGDPARLDEMGHQLAVFTARLQSEVGFYVHACCYSDPIDTDIYWGRGNGWVMVSGYDYLRVRRIRGEADDVVATALAKQVAAAVSTQDLKSGQWWIVLNRPGETYLETSTGALFAYGMARAWRYGFLGDEILPVIALAMEGVENALTTDTSGRPVVSGVSQGTAPGTFNYYKGINVADDLAYGVGAVLLALVETSGLPR